MKHQNVGTPANKFQWELSQVRKANRVGPKPKCYKCYDSGYYLKYSPTSNAYWISGIYHQASMTECNECKRNG
jgi:hypothetical protein